MKIMKALLLSGFFVASLLISAAALAAAPGKFAPPAGAPAQPGAPGQPGAAAPSPYAGNWICDFANDKPGSPTETWSYNFQMAVLPEGQFQATGNYWANSAGFWQPFQASGTWSQEQGFFLAEGYSNFQTWGLPLTLIAQSAGDGILSYRNVSSFGTLILYCQRAQ